MFTAISLAVLRRLFSIIPVFVLVSVMVFFTLRVLPVDPAKMSLPASATIAQVEAKREAMGLNKPIWQQYVQWASDAVQGDFGTSAIYRMPASEVIAERLPATIELAVSALLVAVILGMAGGIGLFSLRGTFLEPVGLFITSAIMALPDFLLAILLILFFGVLIPLFPVNGRLPPGMTVPSDTGFLLIDALIAGDGKAFLAAVKHMVLPVMALGLAFTPLILRVLHASLVATYQQSYIAQARLRGMSDRSILFTQALKNAALPMVVLVGTQFGSLFGGTLLVEMIFSYPGIGNLMMRAIQTIDLDILLTVSLIYCATTLIFNSLADALVFLLNPKLRG